MLKVLLVTTLMAFAHEPSAHVHGAGKVDIAFDGLKGKIVFHAPAESIIGFEHQAKSKKDQQTKDQALKKLHETMGQMISFAADLECEIKMEMYEVNHLQKHADVEAEYGVHCKQSPAGSVVTFHFQKSFSKLKKVQVNVVLGDVQKSLTTSKNGDTLELK